MPRDWLRGRAIISDRRGCGYKLGCQSVTDCGVRFCEGHWPGSSRRAGAQVVQPSSCLAYLPQQRRILRRRSLHGESAVSRRTSTPPRSLPLENAAVLRSWARFHGTSLASNAFTSPLQSRLLHKSPPTTYVRAGAHGPLCLGRAPVGSYRQAFLACCARRQRSCALLAGWRARAEEVLARDGG